MYGYWTRNRIFSIGLHLWDEKGNFRGCAFGTANSCKHTSSTASDWFQQFIRTTLCCSKLRLGELHYAIGLFYSGSSSAEKDSSPQSQYCLESNLLEDERRSQDVKEWPDCCDEAQVWWKDGGCDYFFCIFYLIYYWVYLQGEK